jgi:hypothetical protein
MIACGFLKTGLAVDSCGLHCSGADGSHMKTKDVTMAHYCDDGCKQCKASSLHQLRLDMHSASNSHNHFAMLLCITEIGEIS